MTGALGIEDVERAIAEAMRHLDAARAAGGIQGVRRDKYKQAAQLLGSATRLLDALATPPPSPGGVPLGFVGAQAPSRAPVFGA